MILFRKLFYFTIIFVVAFFCSINFTAAQSTTTNNLAQPFYQPTPQILFPAVNAVVKDLVIIKVYIQPTVVQKMEVYLNSTFLGMAKPLDSINWYYNLDTKIFPNGQYSLKIRSTIITTTGYPIDTFSSAIPIKISNTAPITPTDPTSNTSTPSQDETETATETTQTPKTTNSSVIPSKSTEEELVSESKTWKTVSTVSFPKTSANQLEKIEYRIDNLKKEYLVFSGVATANSRVTLKIFSDPIVITTRADSSGNWEYIFEKPLEPGRHRVEVEIINSKGEKFASGPFNFLIARAQASSDNPTGASLQLVDPMGQTYLYYALAATCLIFLALIVLLIIRARRRKKIKGESV